MEAKYIRVSTQEQNTQRQESNVLSYVDKCSGSIPFSERKQAAKLMQDIDKGKVTCVRVHSISRLGRNTLNVLNTIETITAKGVNVISEKEGLSMLDANGKPNAVSKLIVSVLASVAEMELNRIRERQAEGIAIAKAKGVYKGRNHGSQESAKVFLSKTKSVKVSKLLRQGLSQRQAAKVAGVSINTVRKVAMLS